MFGMLFVALVYFLFHACATAFVADTKNRSAAAWFIGGLFFGTFALLTVGLAEKRGKRPEKGKPHDQADNKGLSKDAERAKKEGLKAW